MSKTLVITDEETKTTWRMPRELLKDLKRYALENDTNVTAVVLRACRSFWQETRCLEKSTNPILRRQDMLLTHEEPIGTGLTIPQANCQPNPGIVDCIARVTLIYVDTYYRP